MEPVQLTHHRLEPAAGRLLVSTALLQDPNFVHTIVLLLEHDHDGSLGVVLNRPSDVPVGDVLGPWHHLAADPAVLFEGGPVSTDSALAIGRRTTGEAVVGWRDLAAHDGLGLLDLDADPTAVDEGVGEVRIYAGYAGWGSGQLEDEIEEGAWVVVSAGPRDAFAVDPAELWSRVLRRQPGGLAWLATLPVDPGMN